MAVAGAEIKIFSAPLHWTSTDLSVRTLLLDGIRRTGEAELVMLVSWALKIQPINQLIIRGKSSNLETQLTSSGSLFSS